MLKRLLAVILALSMMLLAFPVNVFASESNATVTVDDMDLAMNKVADAVERVPELEGAEKISSVFRGYKDVVSVIAPTFTAINGGVTFLRLIGVMEDPTMGKLNDVVAQIATVNDKMNVVSNQLNNIATQMTELKASEEFRARGNTAKVEYGFWKDFAKGYMEDTMEVLMSEYESMLANGLIKWCANENRNYSYVDNSSIIVAYGLDSEGNEKPVYFATNTMPTDVEITKYIIIDSTCLPDKIAFNIDTYEADLTKAIADNMRKNADKLDSKGFDKLTDEDIDRIASDAVDVLTYRIGAAEVNADAKFARKVNDSFTNYCSHLKASEDGIDAMLNTFYLTHSFEFETREDIENFLDRMLLKTGVYGTFVSTINGMSTTITTEKKNTSASILCDTVDYIESARDNGIKGYDNYCYITDSLVVYTDCDALTKALVYYEKIYKDKENYKKYEAEPVRVVARHLEGEFSPIGDTGFMLLNYMMKSNGVTNIHEYLLEHTADRDVKDYGNIVTSYGKEENMLLDGSLSQKVFNVLGDDFASCKTFKLSSNDDDYPDDAESEYIVHHKQVKGSVFNTKTETLSTNAVLNSLAIYGQTHSYWFFDEAAIFTGGNDNTNLDADAMERQESKFDYYTMFVSYNYFNMVALKKVPEKLFGVGEPRYDPFESYEKLINDGPRTPDTVSSMGLNVALLVSAVALGGVAIVRKKMS